MMTPQDVLESGLKAAFPGAVSCVRAAGKTVFHHAVGHRAVIPNPLENATDTQYDLASLTKAMAVGTLLMKAVDDQLLSLDEPVSGRL